MNKNTAIIIVVIFVLILIGFGAYMYFSYRKKSGPFKEYQPKLGAGLSRIRDPSQFKPPSPEVLAKKKKLIQDALAKIKARKM